MKISLIGMSGSGKSHWSRKFEAEGFRRFCVDDLIEEKLEKELKKLGYSGINDVARWMGQPYDIQYPQTSERYLTFEKEIMRSILSSLENHHPDENIIIDTTGSVIYTGEDVLQNLSRLTKIIYLQTPDSVIEKMYQLYIQDPKPVIWGNIFHKKPEESNLDALNRNYPVLLQSRAEQYGKIAHVTLDYHVLRNDSAVITTFLEGI